MLVDDANPPGPGHDLTEDKNGRNDGEYHDSVVEVDQLAVLHIVCDGEAEQKYDIDQHREDQGRHHEHLHLLPQHEVDLTPVLNQDEVVEPRVLDEERAGKYVDLWIHQKEGSHAQGLAVIAGVGGAWVHESQEVEKSHYHSNAEESKEKLAKNIQQML